MAMPMTVSEIAERTGHGASDNRFIERLHYWTRERLLLPIGKRNPGTGRRRLYPDTAHQDARILDAMLSAGVSVEDQQLVMKKFREMRQQQQTPDRWHDHYLVIERVPGRAQARPFFGEGSYTVRPADFERVNYFSLTNIFRF
jgi:DNA-binding transcriptional MerR regulator